MANPAEKRDVEVTGTGGIFGLLLGISFALWILVFEVSSFVRDYAKVHRVEIQKANAEAGR